MGASLEQFLKTGQLGPIILGVSPADIELRLGEPRDRSRKLNPLVLKYGPMELTFSGVKAEPPQLTRIVLAVGSDFNELPPQVLPNDWSPTFGTTMNDFAEFLDSHGVVPEETLVGENESSIVMPSGVGISFEDGSLTRFHISRREREKNRAPALTDHREPSTEQIRSMLDEARKATNLGFVSAGLLMAWGALEASLRRAAVYAGLKGKIGVQPSVLMRELYAERLISPDEVAILEQARQRRTAIVHGLAPQPLQPHSVIQIIELADRLIGSVPDPIEGR